MRSKKRYYVIAFRDVLFFPRSERDFADPDRRRGFFRDRFLLEEKTSDQAIAILTPK